VRGAELKAKLGSSNETQGHRGGGGNEIGKWGFRPLPGRGGGGGVIVSHGLRTYRFLMGAALKFSYFGSVLWLANFSLPHGRGCEIHLFGPGWGGG
jgi:hypothetical protein